MPTLSLKQTALDGLWHNNAGMVQLLGLCPLLAVTNTASNGLGLGIATLFTVTATNVIVSALRGTLRAEIRIPVFVLIIASVVTAIELLVNAFAHDLYRSLGIFLPLIVTNCAIIGRAESFASRNGVLASAVDGLAVGFGFALVLTVLGMLREFIGLGTVFSDIHLLVGEATTNLEEGGLLLAILPPGAFFGLAALIALKQAMDR